MVLILKQMRANARNNNMVEYVQIILTEQTYLVQKIDACIVTIH